MHDDIMTITRGNRYKLDLIITDKSATKYQEIITREVVRGVVIKDDKILLVYPKNEVIYGTPGGGIDEGETKLEALHREMKEEVGASKIEIIEYIGTMTSLRTDFGNERAYAPIHHYYLVKILESGKQNLLPYEADLELSYDYININNAILNNEQKLIERNQDFLDFYTNQLVVLKELKRIYRL